MYSFFYLIGIIVHLQLISKGPTRTKERHNAEGRSQILEPDDLGLNPSSSVYYLCVLGQAIYLLYASVSLSIK